MNEFAVVRIESTNLGGRQEVHVNGHTALDILHNVDTPVTESQFEALSNSNVKFEIVSGGVVPADPEATGESEEGDPALSPELSEAEQAAEAQRVADEARAEEVRQDQERADAAAAERAKAAEKAEKVETKDNGLGTLNGEPFVVADVLAQPITKISEDLDEFSAAQLAALIDAEKTRDEPRVTLLAALQKKAQG